MVYNIVFGITEFNKLKFKICDNILTGPSLINALIQMNLITINYFIRCTSSKLYLLLLETVYLTVIYNHVIKIISIPLLLNSF